MALHDRCICAVVAQTADRVVTTNVERCALSATPGRAAKPPLPCPLAHHTPLPAALAEHCAGQARVLEERAAQAPAGHSGCAAHAV